MTQAVISIEHKEKSAQLIWTGFILSFFLIQAVIWTFAIFVTANDQSHTVVAGYDEKALLWDEEKARRAASAQLGWTAEIVVNPAADLFGFRAVTIRLQDADGQPVTSASLQIKAFHRARAAQPQQITFSEIDDGVYAGQVQVRKSGLWQFDGEALQGDSKFLINDRQTIKVGN